MLGKMEMKKKRPGNRASLLRLFFLPARENSLAAVLKSVYLNLLKVCRRVLLMNIVKPERDYFSPFILEPLFFAVHLFGTVRAHSVT